jgi:hypothetical protein
VSQCAWSGDRNCICAHMVCGGARGVWVCQAIRRNLRLRKEYLYMKSLEGKEKEMFERKQKIKAALAGGCCCAGSRTGLKIGGAGVCHGPGRCLLSVRRGAWYDPRLLSRRSVHTHTPLLCVVVDRGQGYSYGVALAS